MQYQTIIKVIKSVLLVLLMMMPRHGHASSQTSPHYTDIHTGITFYDPVLSNGFRFGMVMPEQPTTDFILQLESPLKDGAGWGGVTLGISMIGPLILVTWPDGDKVMTAARVAKDKTPADVVPYTSNPITLLPIKKGTFVNSTHVCSTFLCAGCINKDSFGPALASSDSNQAVYFGYAFSQTAVADPSNINTPLSDHTTAGGGYAAFRVDLRAAKSDDYDKYAALAKQGEGGAETGKPGVTSTGTPQATATESAPTDSETEMPNDGNFSHRQMSPLWVCVLVMMGVVYLGQAFLAA